MHCDLLYVEVTPNAAQSLLHAHKMMSEEAAREAGVAWEVAEEGAAWEEADAEGAVVMEEQLEGVAVEEVTEEVAAVGAEVEGAVGAEAAFCSVAL